MRRFCPSRCLILERPRLSLFRSLVETLVVLYQPCLHAVHPANRWFRSGRDESTLHRWRFYEVRVLFSRARCALVYGHASPGGHGKGCRSLKAVSGSKAESHIAAGIEHYGKGHWDVAKKHFTEAEQADPQSAEAHYDLALALDKAGDHKSATEHFQRAQTLGKDNMEIQQSEILRKHLKM